MPPVMAEQPVQAFPATCEPVRLTNEDIRSILEQPRGTSHLIMLLREDAVDVEAVVEAINQKHERPRIRIKRWGLALLDALLPD